LNFSDSRAVTADPLILDALQATTPFSSADSAFPGVERLRSSRGLTPCFPSALPGKRDFPSRSTVSGDALVLPPDKTRALLLLEVPRNRNPVKAFSA